jgi:hypothetical protein
MFRAFAACRAVYTQKRYALSVAQYTFDWDDANIEHIAGHRFSIENERRRCRRS